MYCPYCGIEHDESIPFSDEHVIPYGLGGSDGLTIRTCEKSNNDLGSDVDAPFMDFFPIQARRFFLSLESTKGNAPKLDLGGTTWINGQETQLSNVISGDSKVMKIARPTITKTQNFDGTQHWLISGDPEQVRRILEGKLHKQNKLGKSMTAEDGTALKVENLDTLYAGKETTTQNPCVLKTIKFDYLIPIRFFSKLALAMGHYHFGETFSRSPIAEVLRENMTVATFNDVTLHGAFWPETHTVKQTLSLISKHDHHTVAILNGEPRVLMVSLFGEIDALIPLDALPEGQHPTTRMTDGTVWRISLPTRSLSILTPGDLFSERSAEARQQHELSLDPLIT